MEFTVMLVVRGVWVLYTYGVEPKILGEFYGLMAWVAAWYSPEIFYSVAWRFMGAGREVGAAFVEEIVFAIGMLWVTQRTRIADLLRVVRLA
ncbi:MAG: hypothetical protein HG464_002580 [Bacteroidia bacterium]|nr:hypothetical protein [Bacteroidia bacterium]